MLGVSMPLPPFGLRSGFVAPILFARTYARSKSSKLWLDRKNRDPYTKEAKLLNLKSRAAFKLLQIDAKFHLFEKNQHVVDLGYAPGAWSQVAYEKTNGIVLGVDILPCLPPPGVSSIQGNILSRATQDRIRQHFNINSAKKRDDKVIVGDNEVVASAILSTESYLEKEMKSEEEGNVENEFPVDLVLSDMCAPFVRTSGYSSTTTNMPYYRMANTTGLAVRDHQMSLDLCDAALILAIDMLRPGGAFVCKFFTGAEDKLLQRRLDKVFAKVTRFKPPATRVESKECYFVCKGKLADVNKLAVFQSA